MGRAAAGRPGRRADCRSDGCVWHGPQLGLLTAARARRGRARGADDARSVAGGAAGRRPPSGAPWQWLGRFYEESQMWGDGAIPRWFEDWLRAEREVTTLRIWQPFIVPGLLQAGDYARALFLGGLLNPREDAIDQLVAARLVAPTAWKSAWTAGLRVWWCGIPEPVRALSCGSARGLAHLRRPAEGGSLPPVLIARVGCQGRPMSM